MVKQRTVLGLLSLTIILCAPQVLAAPMPISDGAIKDAAVNIVDNSSSDPTQAAKYININTRKRRALDKRAPPVFAPDAPIPEGPTTPKEDPNPPVTPKPTPPVDPPTTTDPKPPVTTDPKPPVTTDPKPPVTTDPKPPVTTDPKPPATTTTTTSTSTSSQAEETTSSTKHTTPKTTGPSKPNPGAPGHHSPAPPAPATTTNSTISPTTTPEKSSGAPILPIVLGSVLGVGVLIAVGAFFFLRFRKGRRFDRKRPLSFLAVSLDDPSGSDRHLSTSSSGGALAGALAVARGGLDRDNDEIRYSPPTPIGANNRFSYQSSDNSGPAVTWNPDDENAALVGGYGQQQHHHQEERDLLSDENGFRPPSESFVASSMMPLAANDPRHQRLSGRQQIQQGAFSPEPEMRELTPGQLRVVGGSPEMSRSEVQPVQGAHESLDVRPEGADVRSQHGSIRSNGSGKDPKSDDIMYL
ncbi:hypothetical protein BGZ81_006966 [Podila clonocystis]|nr:hypothetical protein BGZ81_006966 [Podila clonocystis]